jgi:glycosyltransferase involved in cell wall biosynthesis
VGKNELLGEKIINKLAKLIVVPSTSVKEGMIQYEKVPPSKIRLVPYTYNFEEYPKLNFGNIETIKVKYKANLLLLMCSRFVEPKRHRLVIGVIKKLIEGGLDIKLLLLDDGPLKNEIQELIVQEGLSQHIFFIGYTTSVLDYMAASDLLVHPSLAEASNSSVKEMAIAERTAVVCSGVGDFDDYITNNRTGFLIDPLNSEEELTHVLQFAYDNKEQVIEMGKLLKAEVLERFSPGNKIVELYKALLN